MINFSEFKDHKDKLIFYNTIMNNGEKNEIL